MFVNCNIDTLMILHHIRIQQTRNSTRGVLLMHDPKVEERIIWVCELLEDGYREVKEKGVTRIDPNMYEVQPIQYGRFYEKYHEEFEHEVAFAIVDKFGIDRAGRHGNVRVHMGNFVEDTDGCPLTAIRVDYDPAKKKFFGVLTSSKPAYLRLYEILHAIYDPETKRFKEPVFWRVSEQFV